MFKRREYQRPPRVLPTVVPGAFRNPQPVGMSVAVPKDAPLRSEAFRRYVASFDCFACGVHGFSQCAHANSGFGRGMAIKASDAATFPLCSPHWGLMGCHTQHDINLDTTADERRALEAQYVARMQAQAVSDGWCLATLTRSKP